MLIFLSLETLMPIIKAGKPILLELIDLVASVMDHSMLGHQMGGKSEILNSFKFPPLIQLIEKK